jgi:hypothetical protein
LEQKSVEEERQRALLNVCLEQTTLFKLESQESFLQPETGRTNQKKSERKTCRAQQGGALFVGFNWKNV